MTKSIQFVDLRSQHQEVRAEIEAAFGRILDTSGFVGGPLVESFEAEFAAHVGGTHVVGLSSGTDAVRIALQVVGVGRGDAVVTVAHTFIGTTEGVCHLGALPLFVDVDARSATMSPDALALFLSDECRSDANGTLVHRKTGRRIGAILPVHLYGQSADMAPILDLGERYGVPVVEDAAQAQGARYRFPDGRECACGSMGAAAAFSFYPGKNLGAIGEAGAVVVQNEEGARRARLLRDHGQPEKYVHLIDNGTNARLDAIQAAVLSIKLRRLDSWNEARRSAAQRYASLLSGRIQTPTEMPYAHHVWHLYVVQVPNRDDVRARLTERAMPSGLHYPIPLHRQPAFQGTESASARLPITEQLAATCLSLPMHAHLSDEHVAAVAEALLEACGVAVAA